MTMSLRITSLWVGLTKSSWMTRRTFHNEICLVWTRLSQSRSRDWLMMKWRILLRWASIQVPLQRSTTWLHRHLLWQMWARMGHPLNTQFHRKRHFCRFRMRWGKLTVLLHSVISEILKKWKNKPLKCRVLMMPKNSRKTFNLFKVTYLLSYCWKSRKKMP